MNRVWLHGFTGSDETFASIATGDRRPVLFGHARAPIPAPACFDDEVDRIAAMLGPKTHVIGYSLGGRIALGIATRHPTLVGRLTLVGVHPGLDSATKRDERAQADDGLAHRLEEEGLDAFVDFWESLPMFERESLPRTAVARLRRIRTSHDTQGLAQALRLLSLGRMPPRWADLPALTMPVELMVGEHDTKFRELAQRMASRITQSTLHVVPNTAHDIPNHAPDALWALVHSPIAGSHAGQPAASGIKPRPE